MNQAGSSRMDTVLKLMMIAFFSLFAFSSGVYFGKQMSDSDYQLKALESDFKTHSTAGNGAEGKTHGDEKISDEEVAALTDKFVSSEKDSLAANAESGEAKTNSAKPTEGKPGETKTASNENSLAKESSEISKDGVEQGEMGGEHMAAAKPTEHAAAAGKAVAAQPTAHQSATHEPAAHAAAATTTHPTAATTVAAKPGALTPARTVASTHEAAAAASAKPDLSAAHAAAVRLVNNSEPTAPETAHAKAEVRAPSSLPKVVGASHEVEFTVQVASYPTLEAAKSYADGLIKKGLPAFPVEANVNGKTWYRVSVGSFKTMKDATGYRAQLLKQADLETAIVQRITR